MQQSRFLCLLAIGFLVCGAPAALHGQDPADIVSHYRILPRLSVLRESGGFAGIDRRYRVMGKFDLRTQVGNWTGNASFEHAEVWGSQISDGPVPAVVIDVDQILNLEGLGGEVLPVAAPLTCIGLPATD